jgi:hypothetical protein
MRELIMYNISDIFSKNIRGPEKGRFTLLVHTSKDKVLWTHMRCLSRIQPPPPPLDHWPNTTPLSPHPWKSMPTAWHINASIECDVYLHRHPFPFWGDNSFKTHVFLYGGLVTYFGAVMSLIDRVCVWKGRYLAQQKF